MHKTLNISSFLLFEDEVESTSVSKINRASVRLDKRLSFASSSKKGCLCLSKVWLFQVSFRVSRVVLSPELKM